MNIAILIGISKYKTEMSLPACSLDAEQMERLLISTQKYDDIKVVTAQTNASQVKDSLREFFGKYQNRDDIDEAFIYFSGHGLFQNDALLCCSDFDSSRPATTSISNAELDDLLRSIKPTVAVKIIDACQSGSPYIKDANAGFEKSLGKSQLSSFICMASSRQDQSSYASASESFFTSKWIEATALRSDGQILYRDIQAALADAFVQNPEQTPFFVSQGTGLEVFSTITPELLEFRVLRAKSVIPEQTESKIVSLIELAVNGFDKEFVPHKQALEAVERAKNLLASHSISDPIVKQFYKSTVKTDGKLSGIPRARAVALFADEQSWSKRYLAKINSEAVKIRTLKDPLSGIGSGSGSALSRRILGKLEEDDYVYETRQRPASLEVTEPLPLEVIELSYTSMHPSLPAFRIVIGIVHSLNDVMVLSTTIRLSQKGWNTRSYELSEVKWRYQSYPWSAVVGESAILWSDAQNRAEVEIRTYLESLVPKSDSNLEETLLPEAKKSRKILPN